MTSSTHGEQVDRPPNAQRRPCVEQRCIDGVVEIRDTKDDAAGPVLRFTDAEYAAWLDGAKRGEFDHLL